MAIEKANSAEATICVVDGAHGIYAWDSLVSRYPLFVLVEDDYIPFEIWMKSTDGFKDETLKTVFHPDNEYWCENIDTMNNQSLKLMYSAYSYWDIHQGESGDIFAVNPGAEWDDDADWFILR